MKVDARLIDRVVWLTLIGSALCFTGLLFYFLSLRLGVIAKENQAYNRYNACVLSIPAHARDESEIKRCYDAAEKDTGIKIKSYDQEK
jgi:hypothetical protein